MKTFLVLLSEKQPHLLKDSLLKAHIEFLKKLRVDGYLPICGPFTDNKGAVLIIKADSLKQAEQMIKDDPFIIQKYYKKFIIHEFIPASDDNNWLSDEEQRKNNLQSISRPSFYNYLNNRRRELAKNSSD